MRSRRWECRNRLTCAFRSALVRGQTDGDVVAPAPVESLAAFFARSLIGVAALARAQVDPAQVWAACDVVKHVLVVDGTGRRD